MEWYHLIIGLLSVWRVTHLLHTEDGPFEIFFRMRQRLRTGFLGSLFHCFYCLSIWVAIPAAIWFGHAFMDTLLLVLSFSGGAILLERITSKTNENQIAHYIEDKED